MITETAIQVPDTTGMTRQQKIDARRAGTTPQRDETRYVISGTITDMWRGADRGTADRCVTVIDGTEVHSAGWLLMDSFDTLLTGDEVEVLAEWHEHSGHYWATTGHLACRPPAAPLIPDRPRPRRYRAVIDGREYTGTSPADVAVQRYGDDLQVVADQVERLCTVLDRDGATVIARIHVKEIS